MVYLTGYTPHPGYEGDPRLPHIQTRQTTQIRKTALGAESTQPWEYHEDITTVLNILRKNGTPVIALEQTAHATPLPEYQPSEQLALILGAEVTGLPTNIVSQTDAQLVIPMFGSKESFNVVQAAAMALYHLRFR